ncbi:hypothetical protein AAVH_28153 [Aphelenchoides avenae]|nr:hypothetical protein AAVH_28153 [Aphelenchus avenae]
MTSSTAELIGFEELQPEPCDGTGEDVMTNRYRNKWHVSTGVRRQGTTGSTARPSQLIGLEELQPKPCDGTGEDSMSTRFRKKWLKGDRVRSQSNAELQAVDYAAFGDWFMDQCRNGPEARRLFDMWQQSK